jgi:hypothetical protein
VAIESLHYLVAFVYRAFLIAFDPFTEILKIFGYFLAALLKGFRAFFDMS